MARYRGLTWDHPRGRLALERAAATATDATGERLISWDAQPLEGFEASPIEELAARYDVIVLDHPHLGDAIATGAVRPLDTLFPPGFLAEVERGAVGPSAASYTLDGRLWALPLDAATQVAVSVPELVPTAPRTWAEVADLATVAPVALSLAGPHAFLTFASLCVALGSEPSVVPGAGFVDPAVGERALGMLAGIARTLPPRSAGLNPIGLLERMRRDRDIAYIPLVYGYVNYASGPDPLRFDDAPGEGIATRRGSTIGGTGIAISARCVPDAALLDHLAGLLDSEYQSTRIPADAGQPSLRSAWTDDAVNAASGDFYRRTLATIEESWVRPRVAGYIPFQAAASAVLREAILEGRPGAVDHVNDLFDRLAAVPEKEPPMIQSPHENVLLDVDGAIATITLARPEKLNSVTQEMSDALVALIEHANDDDDIRVIILTGSGERAFCAGSDIRTLDKYATPWDFRNRTDYCDAIRAGRKPVIAAVNGYAFGGGLETALTCDIRLASTTATFAAPEIKLGWIGGGGMSTFLAHSIGPSNAAVMLMTGDAVDAATALRWGLVSEVVEPDRLLERARELAAVIASRPPIAAETAKANLRAAFNMTQDESIRYERDLQTITFATADADEGRAAFAEKRAGVFHRR